VYVYGAKRPNFGTYNISVDGSQEERHDAYAPAGQEGDGLFKQVHQRVILLSDNRSNLIMHSSFYLLEQASMKTHYTRLF
jgi:hypothetical protein